MLPAAKAGAEGAAPDSGPADDSVRRRGGRRTRDWTTSASSRLADKRAIEDHFDRNAELEDRLAAAGKSALLASIAALTSKVQIHAIRQSEQKGLGHAGFAGASARRSRAVRLSSRRHHFQWAAAARAAARRSLGKSRRCRGDRTRGRRARKSLPVWQSVGGEPFYGDASIFEADRVGRETEASPTRLAIWLSPHGTS